MKLIVATDSYKGTISAPDATAIIADALAEKLPLAQILRLPVADGGEGSAECLVSARGGGFAVTTVKNCFFEDTQVRIGVVDGDTAVVELAEAAGLREESRLCSLGVLVSTVFSVATIPLLFVLTAMWGA